MWLRKDIHSHMKAETVYGKQGDIVSLISKHEHVWIVQHEKGHRFSVHEENLSDVFVRKLPPPQVIVKRKR